MTKTRRALLASLMVALTVAAGHSLAGLPNVELVTVLIFVSGFLLGLKLGAVVGAASWGLHSLFNPLGAAVPPILAAQILGGAVVGLTGGLLGPRIVELNNRLLATITAGITGFLLTLLFQILINAASFYAFADERAIFALWKYVGAGIAFTIMHLVWNTGVFLVILRPLLSVLNSYRMELK
jgi:hypothetical protein